MPTIRPRWFSIIAPGILLAATGVGAGDLLTASLAGSEVGLSLLWAVLAGCVLKWTLSEGVARWQMATGTTVLEGWIWRLGNWIQWVFIAYLGLFTLVVGGALMSACGVAASGFFLLGEPATSKIIWGALHSLAGYVLVRYGSFRLFEWLMSAFIGIMFVTVILTAVLIQPDWTAVARGLIPSIPATGDAQWLLAVMGGVGGTVTLLSYGYWIREKGRHGLGDVRICRLDLTAGYVVTALFGLAVMIIGSRVEITNQGATLALDLAQQLGLILGAPGRWLFLAGFWGAVFSSLLGVWQSLPYLFADFMNLRSRAAPGPSREHDLGATKAYRGFLLAIATVPLIFLLSPVRQIQLAFGIVGALFLPLLALTLLILNNRRSWIGSDFLTPWPQNLVLALSLAFFAWLGAQTIAERFSALFTAG